MSDDELGSNIRGPQDVVAFLRACEVPTEDRSQIVLGLACTEREPDQHGLCGAAVRSGSDAEREIDCDQLVALAEELIVCSLVVATIEPGAPRVPSRAEVEQFVTLRRACADEGVVLLDWIVVTGHHWCSLRDQVIREAA
jgi:DNA repair protein RadC